jgi:beta-galactosidase
MWKRQKNPFDYHLYWDEWYARDLEDFVLRDRNHPSVIIWSIGNEIGEQWDTSGIRIARELASIVRKADTTRPVTSGCNFPDPANYIIRSGALDLVGYNYQQDHFADFPEKFPGMKFIASETTSALATRGYYDMPSYSIRVWPARWDLPVNGNPDYTCSAYDNCHVPWGSTHEDAWKMIKKYDFLSGMFIWTGFDYLGEPTPYWWPARSSYFGIVDLAGFPKDAFWLYKSEWTDEPVLHIFPHWNWNEGDTIDVWAYTSCDEVELFLNGQSLGVRNKKEDVFHLVWRVPWMAGELKAVGKSSGKDALEAIIKTAGEPAKIILEADRDLIKADGSDLSFITVRITDADGIVVPKANNHIRFKISGPGFIAGVDNGLQTSQEPFKADNRTAFNGLCLAVVQALEKPGNITLTASSEGLEDASITIRVK